MIPVSIIYIESILVIMAVLVSDKIKKDVIKLLDDKGELTIGAMRTELKTAYNSVRNNCIFLEECGIIKSDIKNTGSQKITFFRLSPYGEDVAVLLKQIDKKKQPVTLRH